MFKKGDRQIIQDFGVRRARQFLAIGVALFLVLFLAMLHKYPAILGEFSRNTLFGAQVIVVAAFIGFTSFNWRCPSCNTFLGNDISRRICRKCKRKLR
jgi:hypothetical protein